MGLRATQIRMSQPPVPAEPTLSLRELSDLIGAIYRGPLESPPWRTVLEMLKARLRTNFAFFILRPTSPEERGVQVVASDGQTIGDSQAFYEYGYALDPFVNLPSDRVVTVDEMIGERAWLGGDFYQQFVAPYDIRYILGADIRSEDGIECRLRLTRPPSAQQFSEADKALCQLLLSHLSCSVRFHSRLDTIESERSLFATAVDRMLVGSVILDERGALMKVNSAAEAILGKKDGIELVRGALQARYSPEENRELQRLITKALGGISETRPSILEAVSITRPSGRQKLGVLVRTIPLSEWSEGQHRPAVAVFIRDPERRANASHEIVSKLFDLTPAESCLAVLLANGMSLEEAAEELDIRKNTARAHLRSIFSKIGVTSQTALVRVLLNSVMYLE